MDREKKTGNRIIANLILEKQKKRLQNRIKNIKTAKSEYSTSKPMFKRQLRLSSATGHQTLKDIEIKRQNTVLFKRIESIIKSKNHNRPGYKGSSVSAFGSNSSMQKSRESFSGNYKIKSISLDEENKLIQKRLNSLKPTIDNRQLFQQRKKNENILKRMGKYPYMLNRRRVHTENQLSTHSQGQFPFISRTFKQIESGLGQVPQAQQIYHHETLDFIISIQYDNTQQKQKGQKFHFQVEDLHAKQKFKLTMLKDEFKQCFEECCFNYEKMVNRLRLNNQGKIQFQRRKQEESDEWQIKNTVKPSFYTIKKDSKKRNSRSSFQKNFACSTPQLKEKQSTSFRKNEKNQKNQKK